MEFSDSDRFFLEKDRIAVFIGNKGEQKKQFEEKFNCKLDIDSKNGEVIMQSDDAIAKFVLSNIVHAINYGHSPQNAMKLEDENFVLDVIDIKTMIKDHNRLKIVIGRVIGKEGSTRKLMEDITKCSVAVKDSYVSVIGPFENTTLVHEALEMLINGSSHKSFYGFLERNRTKMDTGLM
jgi:ribosomal RNA assembly protein